MKKAGIKKTNIKVEPSSGNIFADLYLDDSEELYDRSQIGFQVYRILKERKLKQKEIARLLDLTQPEVSHLMNGHFNRFSVEKHFDFLRRLNYKYKIEVSEHKEGEPYQEVCYA